MSLLVNLQKETYTKLEILISAKSLMEPMLEPKQEPHITHLQKSGKENSILGHAISGLLVASSMN